MIEGFDPQSLVILNLVNPKEKFFGVLRALSAAGVTVRAINLDSFDDWIRQIARGEEQEIVMITMWCTHRLKCTSAITTAHKTNVHAINKVLIFWINKHFCVIPCTLPDIIVTACQCPCFTSII